MEEEEDLVRPALLTTANRQLQRVENDILSPSQVKSDLNFVFFYPQELVAEQYCVSDSWIDQYFKLYYMFYAYHLYMSILSISNYFICAAMCVFLFILRAGM